MSFKQKYLIKTFEICLIVFFIWFTFYGGFLIGSHFDEGWYISEDGYNFIDSAKLFKGKGLEVFVKSDLARQASLNYIFTIILISFLIELENWAYIFFIEFHGHHQDESVKRVIKSIGEKSSYVKVLGSFPAAVI